MLVDRRVTWTEDKLVTLRFMILGGDTLEFCGQHFGVSKKRIYQVKKKYMPDLVRPVTVRAKCLRRTYVSRAGMSELGQAQHNAFVAKRAGARRDGVLFTMSVDDLDWPTVCPILGIPLDWHATVRTDASPSFDRIDPSQGYIPGNVAVISWRANRIKNNASANELKKIAEWLDKCHSP